MEEIRTKISLFISNREEAYVEMNSEDRYVVMPLEISGSSLRCNILRAFTLGGSAKNNAVLDINDIKYFGRKKTLG